jgi:hypothetical protein
MPVEAAWALTFHDLHPDTQQVMRTCAVLDQPSISLVTAAVVANVPLARIAAILAPAESAGWGGVTEDRFDLAYRAQTFLRDLARTMPDQDVRVVLDRIAAEVISGASGGETMTSAVRADVLGVVQAANRYNHPHIGFRVARTVWQTLTSPARTTATPGENPGVDLEWCKQMADHGEEAAIAIRDHEGLLDLLDLSAQVYSANGYWRGAEAAWLGALSIVDALDDSARFVHFLHLLAANYRDWGLPHKTVDKLLEIVSVQEQQGDVVARAETLAAVGTTFLDAGGVEDAEEYLERANQLLRDDAPGTPDTRRRRAVVLGDLGRAHARRGRLNSARTTYHEALILALDIGDDAMADRIRELQAALPPS